MSCSCPTPSPCPQICAPPPTPPQCRVKPIMKGLHWAQTKRNLYSVICLCTLAGTCVYTFLGCPRKANYKEYYTRGEFDDYADEMARKGLFQSIPKESLQDNQHTKK